MEKHGVTLRMKEKTLQPFSYVQTDEEPKKDAKADAAPKPGPYTLKGEKQWQKWAADFTTHQDWLTMKANTRIPYASTLQLDQENTEAPKTAVRGEKQW